MPAIDAMGSDGQSIDLDSAPATYTYNAYDQVLTCTVVWAGKTYRQTYTYVAGTINPSILSTSSGWVLQ